MDGGGGGGCVSEWKVHNSKLVFNPSLAPNIAHYPRSIYRYSGMGARRGRCEQKPFPLMGPFSSYRNLV